MVLLLAVAQLSCTFDFWNKDFATPGEKLHPPNFHLLDLGMSKAEVVQAIGNPDQHIGASMQGGQKVETWEYIRVEARPGKDRIGERYQVVFTEGKLSSYGSSGDFKGTIQHR